MIQFMDRHPFLTFLAYALVGLCLFAFMVVDDVIHGRRFQRRDFHLLFWWPAILPVIFFMGLLEYSRLTSNEEGAVLERPWRWM